MRTVLPSAGSNGSTLRESVLKRRKSGMPAKLDEQPRYPLPVNRFRRRVSRPDQWTLSAICRTFESITVKGIVVSADSSMESAANDAVTRPASITTILVATAATTLARRDATIRVEAFDASSVITGGNAV